MINRSRSLKRIFPAFGAALVASLLLSGLVAGSALALSYSPAPSTASITGGWLVLNVAGAENKLVECEKYIGSASFSSGTTGNASLEFTGCKAPRMWVEPLKCTTAGAPTGTIRTKLLTVRPAYLNAEKTKYGVEMQGEGGGLDPLKEPLGTVATFECGGGTGVRTLSGVITVEITNPLNVETKKFNGVINEATQKAGGGPWHLGLSEGGKVVTPSTSWYMTPSGGLSAKFVP